MTIAYLVNHYPAPSHTFVRRELAALDQLGMDVLRFTIREAPGELRDDADLEEAALTTAILAQPRRALIGALVHSIVSAPVRTARAAVLAFRFGLRSRGRLVRHGAYLVEAAWLRRELGQDVGHVHAHFGTNAATVAALCHSLGGPPYSFTVHGPEEFDLPDRWSLAEKVAGAAFVATISEHGRRLLIERVGSAHAAKITVVRCGVDETFLDYVAVPAPDQPRVVCVARLAQQKRHDRLLVAFAEIVAEMPEAQLVLVGDGELRPAVERTISDLGIGHNVVLAGWQDGEQIRSWISGSRALVLSSEAEGLPVVLMEALAMSRPVVATSVAGIPELVEPGQSGWLVSDGDHKQLVAALRDVLSASPTHLDDLGRRGRETVLANHDASVNAMLLQEQFAGR